MPLWRIFNINKRGLKNDTRYNTNLQGNNILCSGVLYYIFGGAFNFRVTYKK